MCVGRYLDYKWRLNTGISYSMLEQQSYDWQLALAAFAFVASRGAVGLAGAGGNVAADGGEVSP